MLVMRFFTKICSSDHDSLIWRTVKMSMQNLSTEVRERPCTKWNFINYVHRQSWAQQVLAAAKRLDIPMEDVWNMTPGMLLVLQEGRLVEGVMVWEEVVSSRLRSDVGLCGEIVGKRFAVRPPVCCGCGLLAGVRRTCW